MNRDGNGATGAPAKMVDEPAGAEGRLFTSSAMIGEESKGGRASRWQNRNRYVFIGDYGSIALVSDLDGNIIGFHSMS